MANLSSYIDSTYLKTEGESGLSDKALKETLFELTKEAMKYGFYAVMIRPKYVREIKDYISTHNGEVKVGTVIDFPEGCSTTEEKLLEARRVIGDGADELDFVANYKAFIEGETELVKDEIFKGTELALMNEKVAKWIIEIAALTDEQIASLTQLIREVVEANFPEQCEKVFVKSSTGYFKTEGGKPSGATEAGIKIMLANSGKLPVKAAGGIRTTEDAERMIALGVKRLGTSSAVAIVEGSTPDGSATY